MEHWVHVCLYVCVCMRGSLFSHMGTLFSLCVFNFHDCDQINTFLLVYNTIQSKFLGLLFILELLLHYGFITLRSGLLSLERLVTNAHAVPVTIVTVSIVSVIRAYLRRNSQICRTF